MAASSRTFKTQRSIFFLLVATTVFMGCDDDEHRLGGSTAEGGTGTGSDQGTPAGAGNDASSAGGAAGGGTAEPNVPASYGVTCPILLPSLPTYFASQEGCPPTAPGPAGSENACSTQQVGKRCIYPYSLGNGTFADNVEEVYACVAPPSDPDIIDTESNPYWESLLHHCTRTGADCPIDNDNAVAVDITNFGTQETECSFAPDDCVVEYDRTQQEVLDDHTETVLSACIQQHPELVGSGCVQSLTVKYRSGCATQFAVEPVGLTACVQTAFSSYARPRPACALGLSCSRAEFGCL